MEKKSFIKKIIFMMAVQLLLLLAALFFFVVFSYKTAVEDMKSSMANFMQVYGRELNNKIVNADMLLERLIYKNTDYDMLQSKEEATRYYAAMELRDLMNESMAYNAYVDAIVVAESEYETVLSSENTSVKYGQREELRAFALKNSEEGRVKAEWGIRRIGEIPYLYKMYVWQGKATGIFTSIDSFMEIAAESELENMSLLLVDKNDIVWGSYGDKIEEQSDGYKLKRKFKAGIWENRYILADGEVQLYSNISMKGIMSQIKWNMLGMLFIILVSVFFIMILIQNIRREIIGPMKNMTECMKEMQSGNYNLRIQDEYKNREFAMLKDTFNRLMNEILGLKIKSYEKQILLQETELKCVKLQIRPHFFLNAMTTISSLSMQKRNKEIKVYIDALSKNIRYMFRSGLHTVMLEEEIRHVENYFEMQELKYPGCVFYSIEIESGIERWKIPQMLIHTVIENEYKYAIALESVLTILIRARKIERNGEEVLFLEIEDDGKGYPKEVLMQFKDEKISQTEDGSRVGLWSIRRMLQLMYEGDNLFAISNTEPHGCMNQFYIPIKPIHEVRFEVVQNKID